MTSSDSTVASISLLDKLRYFGPAAIVASVSIGAGETILAARAGAWAGYDLMWVVVLSTIVKALFVTFMVGRLAIASEEPFFARMASLPGPSGWFLLLLTAVELLAGPLAWVAIAKACGSLIWFIMTPLLSLGITATVGTNILTTIVVAVVLVLSLGVPYRRLEKQHIAICLLLVAGTALGTAMVRPNLGKIVLGVLNLGGVPQPPAWAPADAVEHPALTLVTLFGYVGGSVLAYLAYAEWVDERGWRKRLEITAKDVGAARQKILAALQPVRWDVCMGALVVLAVTGVFMAAGAAVLRPLESRFEGWDLLTQQGKVWAVIHPGLVWVFYVCALVALLGTLHAYPEIYTKVARRALAHAFKRKVLGEKATRKAIALYFFVSTSLLTWSNIPFDMLTQVAAFAVTNATVALLMVALLYCELFQPEERRGGPLLTVGAVLSCLVLILASVISGASIVQKLAAQ